MATRNYNIEKAKGLFKDNGYKLLSDKYINFSTKMTCEDINGYRFELSCRGIEKGVINRDIVRDKNPHNIYNINNFIKINNLSDEFKLLSEEYINATTQLKFLCIVHNEEFTCGWREFYGGRLRGCAECDCRNKINTGKRLSPEYVISVFSERGYKLIDNYKNSNTKMKCIDDLGYLYHISYGKLTDGRNPRRYHESNPYSIDNIINYCKLNRSDIEILSTEYTGIFGELRLYCNIHYEEFTLTNHDFLEGNGCQICANRIPMTIERIKSRIIERGDTNKIELLSTEYICAKTDMIWKCLIHDEEFSMTLDRYNGGYSNCKECNSNGYRGENEIEFHLNYNKVRFVKQKKFDSLYGVGMGRLSYDFYLCDYNILIEFNGKQHYESIEYFGGENTFITQQEHDRRKREYAKINNIKLLEIPYWEHDNIADILNRELNI